MNSFVVDYKGNMCPCMKLKHYGIKLLENTYDSIWERFSAFSKMESSESYKCGKCDSRYYCDVCPAEMDFMFGNYEYRPLNICELANYRKSFYKKEKSYYDILKEIDDEHS